MLRGQIGRWHGQYVLRSTAPDESGADRRTWHVEHAASRPTPQHVDDEDRSGEQGRPGEQYEQRELGEADTTEGWGGQGELHPSGWPVGSIGAQENQWAAAHP
jgi:hypothetical protein